ncbi:MAG: hypothetical protein JW774_04455 [Candidatus Aureabacteria bacterium]|nr:hypothetical protein [Candidatus Auribacterota bacterium]
MDEKNPDLKTKDEGTEKHLDYKIISENQKIIKSSVFRYNPRPFVLGSGGEMPEEPEIKVKKNEQNVVTGIDVRCVCGRLIQIECNQ